MGHERTEIRTRDGICPAHVLTPQGEGPWPAAIMFMDALGIRPTLIEMAARLAGGGYVVLLPDLFYRIGAYEPMDPAKVFGGDAMAVIGPMMASTGNVKAAEDTEAFLAFFDGRSDVDGSKIGATGFCMGGGITLSVAGRYPDRVAAAASFHGGNLAGDSPDSPHLLAPRMKGEIYVGEADNDPSYPREMADKLEAALTDAGVVHRCDFYAGSLHGWMMPDFPIYDEPAAERGWKELFDLFGRNLR